VPDPGPVNARRRNVYNAAIAVIDFAAQVG
jgi:hypothetical protein